MWVAHVSGGSYSQGLGHGHEVGFRPPRPRVGPSSSIKVFLKWLVRRWDEYRICWSTCLFVFLQEAAISSEQRNYHDAYRRRDGQIDIQAYMEVSKVSKSQIQRVNNTKKPSRVIQIGQMVPPLAPDFHWVPAPRLGCQCCGSSFRASTSGPTCACMDTFAYGGSVKKQDGASVQHVVQYGKPCGCSQVSSSGTINVPKHLPEHADRIGNGTVAVAGCSWFLVWSHLSYVWWPAKEIHVNRPSVAKVAWFTAESESCSIQIQPLNIENLTEKDEFNQDVTIVEIRSSLVIWPILQAGAWVVGWFVNPVLSWFTYNKNKIYIYIYPP